MTFGRLRLSQNKFVKSNQTATHDKDSCLLVVKAQEWNFERNWFGVYSSNSSGVLKRIELRWNDYRNS